MTENSGTQVRMRRYGQLLFAALIPLISSCQTAPSSKPAVLEIADAETLERLEQRLADALGKASVRLGAGDFTETSAIPVLPPRPGDYETRSPATPIIFDLVIDGDACFAIRRDSGDRVALPDLSCTPL